MSDHAVAPTSPSTRLSPSERDWIRRQGRATRTLAAEQHRWVLRAAKARPRIPGGSRGPITGS